MVGAVGRSGVAPRRGGAAPPTTRLRVYSEPSGATVYLDSTESEPLGMTPLRTRVPQGETTVIVRLDGYEEVRERVEVGRSTVRLSYDLERAAYLDLRAADEASFGAEVEVNGLPRGRLPVVVADAPGRALVRVARDGYEPVERWVELTRGATAVEEFALGPPTQGAVLVTADVEGAVVWLDGIERGVAPLVLDGLSVGTHRLALRAAEWPTYEVDVEVRAGEQATVAARMTATQGQLQVLGNVDGAEVRIDGLTLGTLPLTPRDLRAGDHILEVVAPGYEPLREAITIVGGMRRVLAIHLEPTEAGAAAALAGSATISVSSDVPGALVAIDGQVIGPAPATASELAAGAYEIEVTAPDHQPYRSRCVLAAGESCAREALLYEGTSRLRVNAAAPGATLQIDGRPAGALPYDGGLPEGREVALTVAAPGYLAWERTVSADPGETLAIEATLRREGERPEGQLVRSGATLPPEIMAVDVSIGWPYLAEVRFDRGILPMLDAGGALRTFGRLTELEARARYSFEPLDFVVLGAAARLGGGAGPRGVNTVYLLLEGNATVHWERRLAATLVQGLDLYSDAYPFAETDADVPAADTGRQNTLAYRLGFAVDVALWQGWSLWSNVEWTAATTHLRRVLGDIFGNDGESARVFARAGVAFVF
jgi:hypothetical protein